MRITKKSTESHGNVKMRHNHFFIILAMVLLSGSGWRDFGGTVELIPGPRDIGSGCSSDIEYWEFGGIGGKWLAVGQPNILNRRDRVVMRFDLSQFIDKGRISQAKLFFSIEMFGRLRQEEIQVDHFLVERQILGGKDLISSQIEPIGTLILEPKSTRPGHYVFDVTRQVNRDLGRGFGSSSFRLGSNTADKFGNPFNAATGGTVDGNSVKLRIVE